jgi:hypothetical protein
MKQESVEHQIFEDPWLRVNGNNHFTAVYSFDHCLGRDEPLKPFHSRASVSSLSRNYSCHHVFDYLTSSTLYITFKVGIASLVINISTYKP